MEARESALETKKSAASSLVLGAAFVVMAVAAILLSDGGSAPVVRGAEAPGFDLPRLSSPGSAEGGGSTDAGKLLGLSDLEGRVVLVNFWATWCAPCEQEMPAMERLYGALRDEAFELVAIAIDEEEATVQTFQEQYQLSFPIILDLDQSVYRAYQTMGVPESLLIDRDGRIVERYVGPRDWDAAEYEARVRSLIDGAEAG